MFSSDKQAIIFLGNISGIFGNASGILRSASGISYKRSLLKDKNDSYRLLILKLLRVIEPNY